VLTYAPRRDIIIRVRGRTPKEEKKMNTITLCGETIKVNQREERLVRIIRQDANRVLEYFHDNKFNRDTYERICGEIDGLVTAMFYMDLFEKPMSAYDVEEIKSDTEFLEYMFGEDWYKIYE
jgi:hypothetical protein